MPAMLVRPGRRGPHTVTTAVGSPIVATSAIDELGDLVRPVFRGLRYARSGIVLGVAVVLTMLVLFALVGAAVDDRTISGDEAVARAQVLDGSTFTRTLVGFTTPDGRAHVPELGVFYPWGLEVGTGVDVEYDAANPDLVRVARRSALSGVLPLGGALVVVWAVLLPLSRRLRRR